MYMHAYVCLCVYICVYMYICIYVCVYIGSVRISFTHVQKKPLCL